MTGFAHAELKSNDVPVFFFPFSFLHTDIYDLIVTFTEETIQPGRELRLPFLPALELNKT